MLLSMENITFSYADRPILHDFSLSVDEGECVLLDGDNGCGKTTLLQIANGLLFPDSGTYTFDGAKIDHKSMKDPLFAKAFHQKIGYLFQNTDTQLFCATVFDEIAFGPLQMGLSEDEIRARIADLLDLFSIAHLKDRPPYHLSGGEKKKVALAAVLAVNPKVLMLDEPMASLDRKSAEWLADFLAQLRSAGKTILLVSHDRAIAERLSCRVVRMGQD